MDPMSALSQCVDEFLKLDEEFNAQRMAIFLLVARSKRGLTYEQLMEQSGQANSTISRTVGALGPRDRRGNRGLEILEANPDPDEPRRRIVTLTARGRRVVQSLETIIGHT